MERTIGIDLGTTNSEIAWVRDGRPEVICGAGSDADRGYLLDGATGSILWNSWSCAIPSAP